MPNWVFNSIGVSAGSKAELDALLERAKGEQSKIRSEENKDLHFGAFVHPSDEDLPYYLGEKEEEKPEGYEDWSHAEKLAHSLKFAGRNWYDWNVTNWGTKWDAGDVYIEQTDDLSASIQFQTAWSPPEPIFRALAEQFPNLKFDISYEEEQGWGGEFTAENGELTLVEEWDIPNSHAEYVARDREGSCNCAWADDKEDWYDDCPNKQDIFVQVTKVYRLSATTLQEARTQYAEIEMGERELPTEEPDYSSFQFVDEDGQPIEE